MTTNPPITQTLPEVVERAWAKVFETANEVLKAHAVFGFTEINEKLDPSLEQLLFSLKLVEAALDAVYASTLIDYSERRLILNAKQQIGLLQRVAEALNNHIQADYEAAINALEQQAQI